MRIAHVRERHAPAGTPWRLAAAHDAGWLDLEVARRRAIVRNKALAHDRMLFRQPVTTLDDHFVRGLRIEALGELVEAFDGPRDEADDAVLDEADLDFGAPVLRPPSFRDFYAFERHVATMWRRRDMDIPEAWFRLPIFYFSNTSEIRGPDEPVWAPRGSEELDFELEVCAVVDTPAVDLVADRAEEAIGGYTILNDWSARDLQVHEFKFPMGPSKSKDSAITLGPWLVTADELADFLVDGQLARVPTGLLVLLMQTLRAKLASSQPPPKLNPRPPHCPTISSSAPQASPRAAFWVSGSPLSRLTSWRSR